MKGILVILMLTALLAVPVAAQIQRQQPKAEAKDAASLPDPVVTKHSIRAGGQTLSYTVTTGYMPISDSAGKLEARMFFIAYTKDDPEAGRPLMFSFNGGPGSSSVWLHLGALGPKRVKMQPNGFMPPPPYDLVENEHTWLTDTDLVFIDPVGTGYSRAEDPKNQSFFSLRGDIETVGEFIRLYLSRNERWRSPLYLVGESYGTTRASGLSGYLVEKGIAFNGILLVSSVMNFQTLRFADGNDLPLLLILPSYTATAWYHKKLPSDIQSKSLEQALRESERFAIERFGPGLLKASTLSAQERSALVNELSRLTGLDPGFIDRNNLRIELGEFMKELMRDEKRSVGRLDSRFQGIDKEPAGDGTDFDPSMTAIRPPYTATLNDYVRRELGFKSDLEYYILGGGTGRWDWNVNNGYADTSGALRSALQKNPFMKVFIASGYYDMATPYFATEYTIANMNLDPALRRNISTKYYAAGHMMYIEENSLKALKRDASEFIRSSK